MNIFEFIKYSIEEEHKLINKILDGLTDVDLKSSIGDDQTIGSRLKHITSAELMMASYLFSKETEDEYVVNENSVGSLRAAFIQSKIRHIETIDSLNESDLEKEWTSKVSGNSYSYKWLLYHFIEHIATHRGQIAMAIRMSGINN